MISKKEYKMKKKMKKIVSVLVIIVLTLVLLPIINTYVTEANAAVDENVLTYNPYEDYRVGFLGDSITRGTPYAPADYIWTKLSTNEFSFTSFNYGVGGSSYAVRGGFTTSIVERYDTMDPDLDMIFVFGGINDYADANSVLGTSASTDNTEFYGAINEVFTGLKTDYPAAKIYVVTPFKSYNDEVANPSSGGDLEDYVNILIEATNTYEFNLIDLFNWWPIDLGIAEDRLAYSSGDGIHLNKEGSILLYEFLKERILFNLINNNTTENNRYVQSSSGLEFAISGINLTDFIPVQPFQVYQYYNTNGSGGFAGQVGAFYDETQTYVSGITGSAINQTIVIPAGVYFVKLNPLTTALNDELMTFRTTYYTDQPTNANTLINLLPIIFTLIGITSVVIYIKTKE